MSLIQEEENEDHETSLFAMSLATSVVPSYVLKAILELDILEIIKKAGPQAQLSPAQIVAHLPTTNPDAEEVLGRMLRLLASLSVLTSTNQTRPGPMEDPRGCMGWPMFTSTYLTKNEDGVSFAPFSLLANDKCVTDVWNNLKDAVLEGRVPFKNIHGMAMFEYFGKDPRFCKAFYNGMNNHSAIVVKRILETYNGFEGLSSLVDVGGGTGDMLNMIVTKYPFIKGINFYLPHVIKDAPLYPGIQHIGGNMYDSIPQADAIFMKWTLHTGSDEQCLRLLKNCHASLPENGKLIICEYIAPDTLEATHLAKMAFTLDMIMFSVSGGKERTKHEYLELGKQAGFLSFYLICHVCDSWIMEFHKMNK